MSETIEQEIQRKGLTAPRVTPERIEQVAAAPQEIAQPSESQPEPHTAQAIAPKRPTTPIVASAGTKLLATLLEEVRNLDKPWPNTPEAEQQRVIDRLCAACDAAVRAAVNGVAQCGFPFAVGTLESLAIKDGVKAAVKFGRAAESIHTLMDHVGTGVLIVFADPTKFTEGMNRIRADVDQPELPLGDSGRLSIELGADDDGGAQ